MNYPPYLFGRIPKIYINQDLYTEFKYSLYINHMLTLGFLSIRKEILDFSHFFLGFIEIINEKEKEIVYFNKENSCFSYDFPLFVLLCLIDNNIDHLTIKSIVKMERDYENQNFLCLNESQIVVDIINKKVIEKRMMSLSSSSKENDALCLINQYSSSSSSEENDDNDDYDSSINSNSNSNNNDIVLNHNTNTSNTNTNTNTQDQKLDSINSINQYKQLLLTEINKGNLNPTMTHIDFLEKYYINNETLFNSLSEKVFTTTFHMSKMIITDRITRIISQNHSNLISTLMNTYNSQVLSIIHSQKEGISLLELRNSIKNQESYRKINKKTDRVWILSRFNHYLNLYIDFIRFSYKIHKENTDLVTSSSNFLKTSLNYRSTPIYKGFFLVFLKERLKKEIKIDDFKENFKEYDYIDLLSEEDKEEIYGISILDIRNHHKKDFFLLLKQRIGYGVNVKWSEVQMIFQEDPRFQMVLEKEREDFFNIYIKNMTKRIENDFKDLVYKVKYEDYKENEGVDDVFEYYIQRISLDIRGKRMMMFPYMRDKIIKERIRSMKKNKVNK